MSGPAEGGEPATWAEIFAVLGRRYGWTFEQVSDMSLDQIEAALEGLADPGEGRKGRKSKGKKMIPVRSLEELQRVLSGDLKGA